MEAADPKLQAALDAARRLLAAREDGMLTSAEWGDLQDAVDACEHASGNGGDRSG